MSERFGVPVLLAFDGPGRLELGRGEAGYTVHHFTSAREALDYAKSVPAESQTRAHGRLLQQLERAVRAEVTASPEA